MSALAHVTDHTYEYHTVYTEVADLQRSREIALARYRYDVEELELVDSILQCPDPAKQQELLERFIADGDEDEEIETLDDLHSYRSDLIEWMNEHREEIQVCDIEYERLREQIDTADRA